ncbi:MAG: hypothetical protein ACE5IQ_11255 [Candidatus Methylomirabilales bacterium]
MRHRTRGSGPGGAYLKAWLVHALEGLHRQCGLELLDVDGFANILEPSRLRTLLCFLFRGGRGPYCEIMRTRFRVCV